MQFVWFIVLLFSLIPSLYARSIVDMSGQTLVIPEKIMKIYATSPPSTYMLYTIDASLIVGLNFDQTKGHNESSTILDPRFVNLPVIGGLQGGSNSVNRETLLSLHPDVVISWNTDASSGFAATLIQKSCIPTINVDLEAMQDVPKAYRFLGELLDKKERTERLAKYTEDIIEEANTLMKRYASKRPIVYYAQGIDGLSTECDISPHYSAIKLAGGINPHICQPSGGKGLEKVTLEQVILYNPQVIIAQEKEFVQNVKKDPRWRFIDAVKNNKVYLVPKIPFNWVDRPPSFMRFLGVQWLSHFFYNTPSHDELEARIKGFYKLFLHVDLDQKQIDTLLKME